MGYTIPETEPLEIIAGDLITWKKSLSDYPASAGWTLKYSLRAEGSGTAIDITATVDGDDHKVSVAATITALWAAGIYKWQSSIEKGTERYTLSAGTIKIKPSLSAQTAGYDARSHIKKVLDALEALLEGRASRDVMQITINGQSISKMPPEELRKWRKEYLDEYHTELAKENIKLGKPAGNRLKVQL